MLEMQFAICSFTDLKAGIASAEHVQIVCFSSIHLSLVANGAIGSRCWAGEQFEIRITDVSGAYRERITHVIRGPTAVRLCIVSTVIQVLPPAMLSSRCYAFLTVAGGC